MLTRATLFCLLLGSTASANILKNPGFEDGLNLWQTTAGSAVYISDATVVHSGILSAKGVEPNRGSLGRLYQDLTSQLIVGEVYTLSGWIKTQDVVAGGGASFGLTYVGENGSTPADGGIKVRGLVEGTQDWAFFESGPFILPPMPSSSSFLYFHVDFSDASGTAWFDDLELSGPVVPEPGTLALFGVGVACMVRHRRPR